MSLKQLTITILTIFVALFLTLLGVTGTKSKTVVPKIEISDLVIKIKDRYLKKLRMSWSKNSPGETTDQIKALFEAAEDYVDIRRQSVNEAEKSLKVFMEDHVKVLAVMKYHVQSRTRDWDDSNGTKYKFVDVKVSYVAIDPTFPIRQKEFFVMMTWVTDKQKYEGML